MSNQVWVSFSAQLLGRIAPFLFADKRFALEKKTEDEDTSKIPDVSIVESSAEMLYGLVHQRFILTRAGLQAMVCFVFELLRNTPC